MKIKNIKKMKLGVATFALIFTTAASTLVGCAKKNNNTNKPTPTKTIEIITPTESVIYLLLLQQIHQHLLLLQYLQK